MSVTLGDAEREFVFEDKHFAKIADISREKAGINLPVSKKSLVYSRLAKRIRHLRLDGFDAYCKLFSGEGSKEELDHLLSALTTNVTRFAREAHHFDFLKDKVFPDLMQRARAGGRVRIWSSACSSGEEPYSIALSLIETCPNAAEMDIRILATDIDERILDRARTGRYSASILDDMPAPWRSHFETQPDGLVELAPKVRSLVTVRRLNLIEDWPFSRSFDVIMCRNVAIYFDREVQERLWHRFMPVLVDGGHLMIGHSERISGPATASLQSVGVTTYRKVAL